MLKSAVNRFNPTRRSGITEYFPIGSGSRFKHAIARQQRPPILGEIREALIAAFGNNYGWGILAQSAGWQPPVPLVLASIQLLEAWVTSQWVVDWIQMHVATDQDPGGACGNCRLEELEGPLLVT